MTYPKHSINKFILALNTHTQKKINHKQHKHFKNKVIKLKINSSAGELICIT